MKIEILPEAINDDVQDLMADVFDVIAALPEGEIRATDLMKTRHLFEQALQLLMSTDYFNQADHMDIVKSLNIEIDEQGGDLEDCLMHAWVTMKKNLEKAQSQALFNTRFAIFVPVVLRKMNELASQTKFVQA